MPHLFRPSPFGCSHWRPLASRCFAVKGEQLTEYVWTNAKLFVVRWRHPNIILAERAATNAFRASRRAADGGRHRVPSTSPVREKQVLCCPAQKTLPIAEVWFRTLAKSIRAVSENAPRPLNRLYECRRKAPGCLFPTCDQLSTTASTNQFDNLYGCRESLVERPSARGQARIWPARSAIVAGFGDGRKAGGGRYGQACCSASWSRRNRADLRAAGGDGGLRLTMGCGTARRPLSLTRHRNRTSSPSHHRRAMKHAPSSAHRHSNNDIQVAHLKKP